MSQISHSFASMRLLIDIMLETHSTTYITLVDVKVSIIWAGPWPKALTIVLFAV